MRQWRSLEPTFARLVSKRIQNTDTVTYRFEFVDPVRAQTYTFRPGQFNIVSLFGEGEAPVCITALDSRSGYIQHTMCHSLGPQHALAHLNYGDLVSLRGPFGTGWPVHQVEGRHVMFIAEDVGLAPLMAAIQHVWQHRDRYNGLEVLVGSRDPRSRLFISELLSWQRMGMPISQAVDSVSPKTAWAGTLGSVVDLIPHGFEHPDETVALMCGSEETLEAAAQRLRDAGLPPENIHVSLACRMKCGQGKCGQCGFEFTSVCQDGPIFSAAELYATESWV